MEPTRAGQPSAPAGIDLAELIDRFAEVCDAPPRERARWLDELDGRDPAAAHLLRRMLEAEASDRARTLDTPLLDLDAELIDGHATIDAMPSHAPGLGGRYEVLRPVGFGANGDVYLARQRHPVERDVAIKVLRPSQVRPSTIERMAREARALATLSHPHIATVFEAGQTDEGLPFIATEFVAGEPIDAWCRASGASARARIRTLALVCRAVEHMHQRGIIHRDLKPTNILVSGAPEDPKPKILDLGIAKLIGGDGPAAPTLTQPGALLGSLGYIAPEQFSGAPADTRSDVFALGRVLERLLIGADEPWTSRHARDVAAVVRRAVEPDPATRYASAGALAEDLESLLAGRGTVARPASAGEALVRAVRLHPRMALFGAMGTLAVVVAAGLAAQSTLSEARASRDRLRVVELQKELLTTTLDQSVRILAQYAGTLEQRTEMAGRLEQQLVAMVALDPADPQLRVLQARVQTEQARIAQARSHIDRAEALAGNAAATLGALIDPSSGDAARLRHLALAIIVHGDCLSQLGQHERAEERYRTALSIHRLGHQRFPQSLEMLDDLCWSLDRLSHPIGQWKLPDARADREPWLATARSRLELAEHLLALDEDRFLSRFNLAVAHMRLGRLQGEHDDAQAERDLIAAAEMLRALANQDPGRTSVHAHLSTTWSVLTEIYQRQGDDRQAVASQENAVLALIQAVGSQPQKDRGLIRHLRSQASSLEDLYTKAGRDHDAQSLRDRVGPLVR